MAFEDFPNAVIASFKALYHRLGNAFLVQVTEALSGMQTLQIGMLALQLLQ